jgi:predicted Zn-dependent protease
LEIVIKTATLPLIKSALLALLTASLISGCATTTKNSISGVKRSQLLLMPASQITSMSSKTYQQTLNTADKSHTLNIDQPQLERGRRISNNLIGQVSAFRPDATQWKWEVDVEKSDKVNAYCMPGGKIMVLSGLIDKLNPTDDELGAVIGHEIAHALREHGRERMSQAYVQQFGLQAMALFFSKGNSALAGNATTQAANLGSKLFFALPNSREQETEADKIGLELSARAGYNPEAAITLWQKMNALGEAKSPEFLSTHPANANRINELRVLMPKVRPLYDATKMGAGK